jgi:hypothetical protein
MFEGKHGMILLKTDRILNHERYWLKPIDQPLKYDDLSLFDQNGYDLTRAEQYYASANGYKPKEHRYRFTCKEPWYVESYRSIEGAHLNHADLYFRRGFGGDAREQLKEIVREQPVFHKLMSMRPKWGMDISVDYADKQGNVFELLHFEWDGFFFDHVLEMKRQVEHVIANIDWDEGAKEMLERKDEWHSLDFFGQSDWKQAFWGLPKEQFKEVIWK